MAGKDEGAIGIEAVARGPQHATCPRKRFHTPVAATQQGERLTIRQVQKGTPAYEFGLNANDQIVALDGYRIAATDSVRDFTTQIENKKPGDKVRLTYFRFDKLRETEITLGGRVKPDYKLVPIENPTEDQRRLYREYVGAEMK